jgi:hypothetical protein
MVAVRVMPTASSCWFIQVVAVASSVSIARSTPVLAISTMAQIQHFHRYLLNEFQRESMRVKYTILDRHIQ